MHPIYLSRVRLDPRNRDAARLLDNRHLLHGVVNEAVPIRIKGAPRWLWCLDERRDDTVLLVQAPIPPEWEHLSEAVAPSIETKEITDQLEGLLTGGSLHFVLDAAPRRRDSITRRERPLPPDERLDWLRRHLEPAADIQACRVERIRRVTARGRDGEVNVTQQEVQYTGTLRITKPNLFRSLLVDGIGPGKAYGNGLLRIAAPQ